MIVIQEIKKECKGYDALYPTEESGNNIVRAQFIVSYNIIIITKNNI